MIKGIIFDMDGVIVDTEPIYEKVERRLFAELGLPSNDAEKQMFIGSTLEDFWNYYSRTYALMIPVEEAMRLHLTRYFDALSVHPIELMEGVTDLFEVFKSRRLPMVIASSSRRQAVEMVIKRFGLSNYVSGFVSGDAVVKGKPDPEIFLKAAELINIEPKHCLVIEDSRNGIKGAKAAGMTAVGYKEASNRQDHGQADLVIESFSTKNIEKILGII